MEIQNDKSKYYDENGLRLPIEDVRIPVKGDMTMPDSVVGLHNINPKNFFWDNGKTGFAFKNNFLKHLYSLSRGQLRTLEVDIPLILTT